MKFFLLLTFSLLLSFTPHFSHADESYTFIVKKQEQKQMSRWSLSEWLATKEKFKLMDMWLSMHSPSPFEFFLGYDYMLSYGSKLSAGAYAAAFGLEGRYETQPYGDWAALFKFRFFGYHVQGTHLSIGGGVRSRTDAFGAYRNPIIMGEALINITKYVGILGDYEWYLASTPRNNGSSATGGRFDIGAFIDFSFFRLSASYLSESSSDNPSLISGYLLGGKIFF